MGTDHESRDAAAFRTRRSPEWVGVSWAAAGGILAGGLWPVLLMSTGRIGSARLLELSLDLFTVGALVGFVHGVALGLLARPATPARSVVWTVGSTAFWALVASLACWTPAFWMALSGPVRIQGGTAAQIGIGAGWLAGAGVVVWAVVEGSRAVTGLYERWPERGAGTALLVITFSVLVLVLLVLQPLVPGTESRLGAAGAVLVAGGITIWIAAPLVAVGLHRLPHRGAH